MAVFYISGSQGLQPYFHSVYFREYWYDSTHKGPNDNYVDPYTDDPAIASAHSFYDQVNFDADHFEHCLPNIHASMVPVTVDRDIEPNHYGPWRIKIDEKTETFTNESGTVTRTIEIFKEFEILRFKCDWSVNLWLDGKGAEISPDDWGESTYSDLELWLRIVPQRFCYFVDNPKQVYFAPALMQLSQNAEWYYVDKDGDQHEDPSQGGKQDIFPEAQGETLGIFYAKGAQEVNLQNEVLSYQGALLDPAIFRNEYWIRFCLYRFRPTSFWNDPLHLTGYTVHLPSTQLKFLVYVFVVGEWEVKLYTDEIKPLEPHQTQWARSPWDQFWLDISDFLKSPWGILFTLISVFLIVFVILAVTGTLPAIAMLILSRKQGGGRQKKRKR